MSSLLGLCWAQSRRWLAAGEVLIGEGGACDEMYVVVSGQLTATRAGLTIAARRAVPPMGPDSPIGAPPPPSKQQQRIAQGRLT